MGVKTGILWTDSTFNPWWGCAEYGPGCHGCYAKAWDARTGGGHWGVGAPRRTFGDKHWNEPKKWNADALRSGKPHRVFCASMADVFDTESPHGERERLWRLMRETPALSWQIVTKRIANARDMLPPDWDDGYPNVWLLSTIVTQKEADRDIPILVDIPARIHGLSMEPLLEQVGIPLLDKLDWVIVGGESGANPREMKQEWAIDIQSQCSQADVAFFFKQHGGKDKDKGGSILNGQEYKDWPRII